MRKVEKRVSCLGVVGLFARERYGISYQQKPPFPLPQLQKKAVQRQTSNNSLPVSFRGETETEEELFARENLLGEGKDPGDGCLPLPLFSAVSKRIA